MTEEEAKTKTCLQTLAPVHDQLGGVVYGPATCIASECMAWRWRRKANPDWNPHSSVMATWPPANPYAEPNPQSIASTTDGFCGIAGQPQ